MTDAFVFIDRPENSAIIPDYDEVFRYMGYHVNARNRNDDEVRPLVYEVVAQFQKLIVPQSVYVSYPVLVRSSAVCFAGQEIESAFLSNHLAGCHAAYMFAATIGPKIDREIQRCQRLDPVRAVVMQAAGAMFIEAYCDCLCKKFMNEVSKDGCSTCNRFSPGYGDLNLEVQKVFFSLLDCKKIGLTLMDTLIMAPEKSVTAFVGVKKNA